MSLDRIDNCTLFTIVKNLDMVSLCNFAQTSKKHMAICKKSYEKVHNIKHIWHVFVDTIYSCIDRDDHNSGEFSNIVLETLLNSFVYAHKLITNINKGLKSRKHPIKVIEILSLFLHDISEFLMNHTEYWLIFPVFLKDMKPMKTFSSCCFQLSSRNMNLPEHLRVLDFFVVMTLKEGHPVSVSDLSQDNEIKEILATLKKFLPNLQQFNDIQIVQAFCILFGIPFKLDKHFKQDKKRFGKDLEIHKMKVDIIEISKLFACSIKNLSNNHDSIVNHLLPYSIFYDSEEFILFVKSCIYLRTAIFSIAETFSYGELLAYNEVSKLLLSSIQPMSCSNINCRTGGFLYEFQIAGEEKNIDVKIFKNGKKWRYNINCWTISSDVEKYVTVDDNTALIASEVNEFIENNLTQEQLSKFPLILPGFTSTFFELFTSNVGLSIWDNKDVYFFVLSSKERLLDKV